jgi:hypothetical protein
LIDGLTANESLQKLTFQRCIMGQQAVSDLVAYMQSPPIAVDVDGTTTTLSSIRELYFKMMCNPFHRAQEKMSSVAKAIFTIPRGQETSIACHNLRVFDCERQNDFGDFPFKNFNGLFYLLGTKASTLQLRRFCANIVSSRALRGLCGLIPKLVRLEELAVHFCNDEDETIRESELRDGVLQETVRRKLVKALRRNGSIHTVQLERRDMGSEGPSSDLGRLGNAYLERNRRIPQMLAAPPRFSDTAEVSVAAPSSEHATLASLFPALFQCSSKTPNMTPKNVLSGLRSFGEGTGPDGSGKRAQAS